MSRLTCATLTAACLLQVNIATAEPFVVDQQFVPLFPLAPGEFAASVQPLSLGPSYGQVFSVGLSGRLVGADLILDSGIPGGVPAGGQNDVIVTVASTSGGFPTSTVLAGGIIPGTSIPAGSTNRLFTHVDFESPPQVIIGQQLALLFSSLGPLSATSNIFGNTGASLQYPGGEAVVFAFGAWHPAIEIFHPGTPGSDDFFFRTTVQPVPVPEPASITLLGTGLLGLAFKSRRTSSRQSERASGNGGAYDQARTVSRLGSNLTSCGWSPEDAKR